MTASDTRDYLRTKSQTKEGQHKARVMVQIDFHTLLKELHASQQGSIKQNLNDEIKLKAVQDAVRGVYEDLMDTMEGRNKTAVNNEVKSKANAQDDIDLIKGLKASLVGVLKSKVTEEVLAQDQSDAIRRQISSDMADTVDKLQTGYGYQKLLPSFHLYQWSDKIVS